MNLYSQPHSGALHYMGRFLWLSHSLIPRFFEIVIYPVPPIACAFQRFEKICASRLDFIYGFIIRNEEFCHNAM